jgi:hypothetical protein
MFYSIGGAPGIPKQVAAKCVQIGEEAKYTSFTSRNGSVSKAQATICCLRKTLASSLRDCVLWIRRKRSRPTEASRGSVGWTERERTLPLMLPRKPPDFVPANIYHGAWEFSFSLQ